jgi:cytochrome c553
MPLEHPFMSVNSLIRKRQMNKQKIIIALVSLIVGVGSAYAGSDRPTKFSNKDSIANTRHNLTQSTIGALGASKMDEYRNNYGEVCVYCHTPHGADGTKKLPLWNRTTLATNYQTYNQLNTTSLTQEVSQPGVNSLSCLSCHDGQTAIDSIINMPGSGRYLNTQASGTSIEFLNSFPNPNDTLADHNGLNSAGCLSCHAPGKTSAATDFTVFAIGTDLTNDHPVGITFPSASGTGTDFNKPTGLKGTSRYFDANLNGNMDSGDVRLYDTGGTAKVECASCHDPHGVPSAGPGSAFKPTFLRVNNTGSALCLTCHVK